MSVFFITVPHAGETIPEEVTWLKGLPEQVVMCDVDRYVDELYGPGIQLLSLKSKVAEIHRYVVDLNRIPEDIDQSSVENSVNPPGSFTTGFHWSETTTGAKLIKDPITLNMHNSLTELYYKPFHNVIAEMHADVHRQGFKMSYHLDAHSMPSRGTSAHRDPGMLRPEIVVSDRDGSSCNTLFKDLVMNSYKNAGFQVSYNWPYKGGRITETYGQPSKGQSTIQVELNRALYMDELNKKKNPNTFGDVQKKITQALAGIVEGLRDV